MVARMARTPPPPPSEPEPAPKASARFALVVVGLLILGVAVWAYDGGIEGAWVDPVAGVVGLSGLGLVIEAFRA